MNRLLVLVLSIILFAGCKKADDPAVFNDNQASIDDNLIINYISSNNLTGFARTSKSDTSGVWYKIEKQGSVPVPYSLSSKITVAYTGRLLTTQEEFVNITGDIHPSYVIGETIKGWQSGILTAKVNKGGRIRLLIPSRYAYGPFAQPQLGLPANAVLDFTIDIFDVTN